MKLILRSTILTLFVSLVFSSAWGDEYSDTKTMFERAGISYMFESAYGYALFPLIGKAGFVVGGAYGQGRVYVQGKYFGNTSMTQATIGFQLGGSGFSQVVFFQDKNAFAKFITGKFEFGADAEAVVLTAAVGVSANTGGSSSAASGGQNNATVGSSGYYNGMATYTITKGGLMYEASIGGQRFSHIDRR